MSEEIQEREGRYGVVFISPEFILGFLMKLTPKGQIFRCIKGLPEDARIVRAGYDDLDGHGTGRFALVIEHESFSLVRPGDGIPELTPPTFETIRIEAGPEFEEAL